MNISNAKYLSYLNASILMVLICIIFSISEAVASTEKIIPEIFIASTGHNKYEAKIKAHEQGMLRSLYIISDKLGFKAEDISPPPYSRLKTVFTPTQITNELSLAESYNATVDYRYTKGKIYSILLEYGNNNIEDSFYEYLVLPVFKQSSFYNVWDKDKRWLDLWHESYELLDNHKLYLPSATPYLESKITKENLFSLKYDDFIEIFRDKRFKGVLLVSAEFFTNRRTRESLMQVNTHILSSRSEDNEVFSKDYPLNEFDDIPYTVDLIIDRLIDDFGALRHNEEEKEEEKVILDKDHVTPIVMNFDVYDPEELDIVISKLEEVMLIDKFRVEHDYNTRYKFLIYTKASEFELAESLYLHGLSYKIYGNVYHLIDIKEGI